MTRLKRSSVIVDKAQWRLAGLKSIDTSLDLGNGLTVKSFGELIEDTRKKLESYNTALSVAEQTKNLVEDAERSLAELSELMLKGVACK